MAKRLDIQNMIGKKFTNLTILSEAEAHITKGGHKRRAVICQCDCGKIIKSQISPIISKSVKSCGCYSAKLAKERMLYENKTHGMVKSPEYNSWRSMKKRCYLKAHKSYKYYGGRGIIVCDRWLNSFENFLQDMGIRPEGNYSLDRIDNNGDYCPENCRWATLLEQGRNQRTNVNVTYQGETKCIAEWAEVTGMPYGKLHYRITVGKDINKCFE
jgi:hypothetical protein